MDNHERNQLLRFHPFWIDEIHIFNGADAWTRLLWNGRSGCIIDEGPGINIGEPLEPRKRSENRLESCGDRLVYKLLLGVTEFSGIKTGKASVLCSVSSRSPGPRAFFGALLAVSSSAGRFRDEVWG